MCIKAAISRQRISVQIQSWKSEQSVSKMLKLLSVIFMTIVISHIAELKVPSNKKLWKMIKKNIKAIEENEEAIDYIDYNQTVILNKAIS